MPKLPTHWRTSLFHGVLRRSPAQNERSDMDGELLSDDESLAQKQRIKDEMDALDELIKAQKDNGTLWIYDCERFIANT